MQEDVKGNWLWLGCSNEKNFKKEFENEKRKFELCTKLNHFKTMIETAHEGYEYLTVMGIDNIVADISGLDSAQFRTTMVEFFGQLEEQRKKGMKIVVGPLLPWKRHSKETKRAAVDVLKEMKVMYPGIKHLSRLGSLSFGKDNVHLTERAATNHFKFVFNASTEAFFNNDDEYLTEDDQTDDRMQTDSGSSQPVAHHSGRELEFSTRKRKKVADEEETDDAEDMKKHSFSNRDLTILQKKFEILKQQVTARWTVDLVASAGTKEDLDRIENNMNMNKIVVMGLNVPELWEEEDWKVRLAKIKDAVADLLNFINPGVDYNLGYVKHLNAKIKAARQIVEVTLESEKKGKNIRKAYAEKIKEWRANKLFPDRMAGVSITPALTIATRVRIAILKAIAKMLEQEFEDTEAWVIQHVSRPVLKVKQKAEDGKEVLTSYGFAQSVAYVLKEMPDVMWSEQQLFEAYTVAGTRFGPQISHHFVILEMETAMDIAKGRRQKHQKQQKNQNQKYPKKK